MHLLAVVRACLLALGVFKLLLATLLDDVMLRHVSLPLARRWEFFRGKPQQPAAVYMLEHPRARRLYNFTFGAILLGAWWFLGTPAGVAMIHIR